MKTLFRKWLEYRKAERERDQWREWAKRNGCPLL